jgi:hypothetical protein
MKDKNRKSGDLGTEKIESILGDNYLPELRKF